MEPDEYFAFGIYTARTPRAVLADRVETVQETKLRAKDGAPLSHFTRLS
jgi:hypothetical protein